MPSVRAEDVIDESKKFLSPGSIWQKVLVPQHDLSKSFGTPITQLKIAQKVFVPLLQHYNSFRTPGIEQKKFKEFHTFLKLCFKIIFSNAQIKLSTFL